MPREGISGDFLILDVSTIDVKSGVLRENQNILVQDGKIVTIESVDLEQAKESYIVIDGTGKFLMPSLWDMHIHSTKLSSQYQHPLLLANGVTSVRDMGGCMSEPDSFFACTDDKQRWNQEDFFLLYLV